jgi:hypothetical protein
VLLNSSVTRLAVASVSWGELDGPAPQTCRGLDKAKLDSRSHVLHDDRLREDAKDYGIYYLFEAVSLRG